VFFLLYSSTEAFGTLQSLQLIPAGQSMTLASLVPFRSRSLIQLPSTLAGLFTSPIFLLWAYVSFNQHLQSMLWYIIRTITIRPDKPDRISHLALKGTSNAEAKIPGLRDRPWSLLDEVRFQSSKLKNWFGNLLKPFVARRRTSEYESFNISAQPEIDPPARSSDADPDRASTATPDPADLFDLNEIELQPQSEANPNPAESEIQPLSRTNTLYTPLNRSPATTPPISPRVRPSLIHRESGTVTMQLELLESQVEIEDQLRIGSHEAPEEMTNNSEGHTDPITAEEIAAAADIENIVSELARTIHERDVENRSEPPDAQKRPQHRVTALSNFSSDAFASHAACLITTAALIPLETMFVRSLSSAFLPSSTLTRDVRPLSLSSWRDWRYNTTILGLLGLQALVSSAVWSLGTGVAIGLGRMRYRWGKL
jgi:hypothetical protein